MKTIFRNETANRVPILDYGKRMLFALKPGEERSLPDGALGNPYDRFSEITYCQDKTVRLRGNPDWRPPEGWVTEFENRGPNQAECIRVDDTYEWFYRFIPRILSMSLNDANVFFARIVWSVGVERTRHWDDPNRFCEFQVSKVEKTLRPPADVERIKAEIDKAAVAASHSTSDRQLRAALGQVGTGITVNK